MADAKSDKAALRREMRPLRRALPDRPNRSEQIWTAVESLDVVRSATVIMAFDSIDGEPVTSGFVARRRAAGQRVAMPEDVPPPAPDGVDVVLVPGIAFTTSGDRLGQGGGWYDRFLAGLRAECVTIGVGFAAQIVDRLPTEPHDVRLDAVVTELGVHWAARSPSISDRGGAA